MKPILDIPKLGDTIYYRSIVFRDKITEYTVVVNPERPNDPYDKDGIIWIKATDHTTSIIAKFPDGSMNRQLLRK